MSSFVAKFKEFSGSSPLVNDESKLNFPTEKDPRRLNKEFENSEKPESFIQRDSNSPDRQTPGEKGRDRSLLFSRREFRDTQKLGSRLEQPISLKSSESDLLIPNLTVKTKNESVNSNLERTKMNQQASSSGKYRQGNFDQTRRSAAFTGPQISSSQSGFKSNKVKEQTKQQVVSITYEEIGLFPRSFNRVFDRFFKQLFFDVENLVIQEYRFYRYLFLTTVKCVFILVFIPFLVNFVSKNYLVRPITEYYWNAKQPEIFLNSYMQKRAFTELKEFEEKIYFESLILPDSFLSSLQEEANYKNSMSNVSSLNLEETLSVPYQKGDDVHKTSLVQDNLLEQKTSFSNGQPNQSRFVSNDFFSVSRSIPNFSNIGTSLEKEKLQTEKIKTKMQENEADKISSNLSVSVLTAKDVQESEYLNKKSSDQLLNHYIQKRLQTKTLSLAIHYNEESIEAITNFFADILSFTTLCFLLFNFEIQINITKSFLLEVFFGLDDSKKSLFILFVTDLLVGYHSPNIWELFFSSIFDHYGLPENETTIFLLVATLPVLLDVLFKYLIFRHLNRASPATVATYHAMIE